MVEKGVTGGGKWTVIPVEMRDRYMKSLETASVEGKADYPRMFERVCARVKCVLVDLLFSSVQFTELHPLIVLQ